jgi:hypothetical protein
MTPTCFRAFTALLVTAASARAQDAVITYLLGRDTVAVERFTRTPARFEGEAVTRNGTAVARIQYDITLANGRPATAVVRRRQANGSPFANAPTELRYTFRGDSAVRTTVWPDSNQTRAMTTPNAIASFPVFVYAPFELLRGGTDTMTVRGGPYAMFLRFDRNGRLQSLDGTLTTLKVLGTRSSRRVDIAALAAAMKPTGVLSPRGMAYAAFSQGPIFINYGRPAVRERTVWGGTLIPFDTIWRAGANEATHLATSKTIVLGDMTLAPGLYTLWIQHTRNGTFLVVNKQVGQWGTQYQASQDIGRVAMTLAKTPEHVEDYTITIRPTTPNHGAIDFAWADTVATAEFTVRP